MLFCALKKKKGGEMVGCEVGCQVVCEVWFGEATWKNALRYACEATFYTKEF
jgi:hypothetical protein